MNCKDVARVLSEESRLPFQAQDHVRSCNRDSPVSVDAPSPATLRQMAEVMAANLQPVRPVGPAPYFFGAFVSLFVSIVAGKTLAGLARHLGAAALVRTMPNTAAAIGVPEACYDMVRVGGGIYGLSTLPGGAPPWLRIRTVRRAGSCSVRREGGSHSRSNSAGGTFSSPGVRRSAASSTASQR